MSNVINFDFNQNQVRIVELEDGPWFVAADVCRVLGISNPPDAIKKGLEPEEQQFMLRSNIDQIDGSFPNRGARCVSESGLYKLIMRSDKAEARPFQNWVTQDVLPAIRKDGGYIMGEEKLKTGEMDEDELVLKAMEVMQGKIGRLEQEKKELADQNNEMKPKAHCFDQLMNADGTLTTTQVAHTLGTSANELNKFLRSMGIKFKDRDQPKVTYLRKDWFKVNVFYTNTGKAVPSTRITPQGAAEIAQMYEERSALH